MNNEDLFQAITSITSASTSTVIPKIYSNYLKVFGEYLQPWAELVDNCTMEDGETLEAIVERKNKEKK